MPPWCASVAGRARGPAHRSGPGPDVAPPARLVGARIGRAGRGSDQLAGLSTTVSVVALDASSVVATRPP